MSWQGRKRSQMAISPPGINERIMVVVSQHTNTASRVPSLRKSSGRVFDNHGCRINATVLSPSASCPRSSSACSKSYDFLPTTTQQPWPCKGRVRSTTGRCFRFIGETCARLFSINNMRRRRKRKWRSGSSYSSTTANVCMMNQSTNHYGNDSHYSEAIEDCIDFFNTSYRKASSY